MTTLSTKPSTVSTRSTGADHGETSRLSSSPPLNGSMGSTTEGSWSPLAPPAEAEQRYYIILEQAAMAA